ncbi:hypothetical protein BKK79_02190 [Cupriavidus sp. USMAA2-4]|nr:hypothetical protein BKK79_02190 [Cupriavidus sp. USMAA2-4]
MGGQIETAQRIVAQMLRPEQQGAARAGAQNLLGRPQGVGGALAAQPQQLSGRQSPVGQGQPLRRVGRIQEYDRARS